MRLSIDNTDSGPRSESGPGRQAGDAGRLTGASGDGARCGEISRDPGRDGGWGETVGHWPDTRHE